ncbi:MFS transporter [Microbacterium sp. MEC084]|nr:MFS transporter [Microbacterium sp. MEC084]
MGVPRPGELGRRGHPRPARRHPRRGRGTCRPPHRRPRVTGPDPAPPVGAHPPATAEAWQAGRLTALSLAQLVSWGILFYALIVAAPAISDDTGWPLALVTALFSLGLIASAILGVPVGRILDRGPRGAMTVGSIAGAGGLMIVALAPDPVVFGIGWLVAGAAQSAVLYQAAFTVLAHRYRRHRRGAMTVLTLAGGLASTVFARRRAADRHGLADDLPGAGRSARGRDRARPLAHSRAPLAARAAVRPGGRAARGPARRAALAPLLSARDLDAASRGLPLHRDARGHPALPGEGDDVHARGLGARPAGRGSGDRAPDLRRPAAWRAAADRPHGHVRARGPRAAAARRRAGAGVAAHQDRGRGGRRARRADARAGLRGGRALGDARLRRDQRRVRRAHHDRRGARPDARPRRGDRRGRLRRGRDRGRGGRAAGRADRPVVLIRDERGPILHRSRKIA